MSLFDNSFFSNIAERIIEYLAEMLFRSTLLSTTKTIVKEFTSLNQINLDGIPTSLQNELFLAVSDISQNIIHPIGCMLLGIFLMMEFIHLTTRYESSHGISGVEMPVKAILKMAVSYAIFRNLDKLLMGTKSVTDEVQFSITTYSATTIDVSELLLAVEKESMSMNFGELFLTTLIALLICGIIIFGKLIVSAIAIGRIFQLYIYVALAAIPLSTLPSTTQHSIAVNFIKGFVGVCLQGVCLAIIFYLFGIVIKNVTVYSDGLVGSYFNMAIYTVVLLMAVWGSNQLAKELVSRI